MEELIEKLVEMSKKEERIYGGYSNKTQARPLMAKARCNLLSELLAYAETRRNKEKPLASDVDFKVGDMERLFESLVDSYHIEYNAYRCFEDRTSPQAIEIKARIELLRPIVVRVEKLLQKMTSFGYPIQVFNVGDKVITRRSLVTRTNSRDRVYPGTECEIIQVCGDGGACYRLRDNNVGSVVRADSSAFERYDTQTKLDFKVGDMVILQPGCIGPWHKIMEGSLCQIVSIPGGGKAPLVKLQEERTGILTWANRSDLKHAETKLPRFHEAQVGDLVYCMVHGEGVIKELVMDLNHDRISCYFPHTGKIYTRYQMDGRVSKDVGDPVLFYRKGSEKYLTERPELDTDWTKVSKGTRVRVWNSPDNKQVQIFAMYLPDEEYKFLTYATASGKEKVYVAWKNAEVL